MSAWHVNLVWRNAEIGAAERFSLLRSGLATDADRSEIEEWRAHDPAHENAWSRVLALWELGSGAATEPSIVAMRRAALASPRSARPDWLPMSMAAGLIVALSVSLWSTIDFPGQGTGSPQMADASAVHWSPQTRTAVGQLEKIELADGSVVTVNTNSAIRTALSSSARRVRLDRGEAYFDVARNSVPFKVTTGSISVTALGTSFSVRNDGDDVVVTLQDGSVSVYNSDEKRSAILQPGWQLRSGKNGFTQSKVDVGRSLSWVSGALDFDRRPLGDVVAELNRYSDQHIILADNRLVDIPISGLFPAGQPDRLVTMLVADQKARVVRRTASTIELAVP